MLGEGTESKGLSLLLCWWLALLSEGLVSPESIRVLLPPSELLSCPQYRTRKAGCRSGLEPESLWCQTGPHDSHTTASVPCQSLHFSVSIEARPIDC